MKKLLAMVIILGWVFCMFPQDKNTEPAPKNTEPTLEETLQWIKEKLKDEEYVFQRKSDGFLIQRSSNYILTWDDCKVTITYKDCGAAAGGYERTLNNEFLLSDLDLNSFEYSVCCSEPTNIANSGHNGLLKISTVKKEDKIKTNNGKEDYFRNNLDFPVSKPEMVDRMIKAWENAIKLCGGKETKEPF
jgi:hypothetical protein